MFLATTMSLRKELPSKVAAPYPVNVKAAVKSGFGRGSSELGFPTANIEIDSNLSQLNAGVYFGWCSVSVPDYDSPTRYEKTGGREILFNCGRDLKVSELIVYPMVMSVGWNPFYKLKEKAAEVHIIHEFQNSFYGAELRLSILGYVRPELDYTTKGTHFCF